MKYRNSLRGLSVKLESPIDKLATTYRLVLTSTGTGTGIPMTSILAIPKAMAE